MRIKTISRTLLLSGSLLAASVPLAQAETARSDVWQDLDRATVAARSFRKQPANRIPILSRSRQVTLDMIGIRHELNQAPMEDRGLGGVLIALPLPGGGFKTFTTYRNSLADGLADTYPEIRTFSLIATDDPSQIGRLDVGPNGFHAIYDDAVGTVFIDPTGIGETYQTYYKSDFAAANRHVRNHFSCGAENSGEDHSDHLHMHRNLAQRVLTSGAQLRTYRTAVAATAEYTAFHGGKPQAVAAIVTAINRVNQVFQRDLGVRLELIANNADIVYTDANTDPFTNNDANTLITEVQAAIDGAIGAANYDVGHVFATSPGGIAALGSVCSAQKAEGVTGTSQPVGDPFVIDFVAHEFGHQFSAEHTFNGTTGSCNGSRSATAAYEPASGSSIMAYAGICGEENIATAAHDNFHIHSLGQVTDFVANAATGGSCGTATALTNNLPVVTPGADGTIPANTPFELTGSATDADGDTLTYSWEQYDLGPATSSRASFVDDGQAPIFRAFSPKAGPTRVFPQETDLLNGTTTYGETLPTTNRDLNFRLVVRDGKGGIASGARKLTVVNTAGPFTVTDPGAVSWQGGTAQTLTWAVANTTAAPVSCANVEIAFSTDGGQTFAAPTLTTPNDGTQSVTIPNTPTTTGRVRVKCASQPFLAVNGTNFTITAGAAPANTVPVAQADAFTVGEGAGATQLTVLQNDSDADGDTLTITRITGISAGGTATVNGTAVQYQPAAGFSGTETFSYTIADGKGGEATAQVTVTVTPNTAPVAVNDTANVNQDSAATDVLVLANDSDADGDALTITAVGTPSQGGTATANGQAVNYQPAAGISGTETLTYTISDGRGGTATATVTVTIAAAPAPAPTPTPAPVPTPQPTADFGGGGVSFGPFLLLLLALGRKLRGLTGLRRRRAGVAK